MRWCLGRRCALHGIDGRGWWCGYDSVRGPPRASPILFPRLACVCVHASQTPSGYYFATCSRDVVKVWMFEGDKIDDARPLKVKSPRAIAWNHSCACVRPAALPCVGCQRSRSSPSSHLLRPWSGRRAAPGALVCAASFFFSFLNLLSPTPRLTRRGRLSPGGAWLCCTEYKGVS